MGEQLRGFVQPKVVSGSCRCFISLIVRLAWFAFCNSLIRIVAICVVISKGNEDLKKSKTALLSKNVLFYAIYLGFEAICLAGLCYTVTRFYFYHLWLKKNNMTTYQHILEIREKNSSKNHSKISPVSKVKVLGNPRIPESQEPDLESKEIESKLSQNSKDKDFNDRTDLKKKNSQPTVLRPKDGFLDHVEYFLFKQRSPHAGFKKSNSTVNPSDSSIPIKDKFEAIESNSNMLQADLEPGLQTGHILSTKEREFLIEQKKRDKMMKSFGIGKIKSSNNQNGKETKSSQEMKL